MVFGIVHQVCSVVPGHDVALFIAVPHQHAAFEHFEQTGAAVHLALFNHCALYSRFVLKFVLKVVSQTVNG
jgi:hypothetical protein